MRPPDTSPTTGPRPPRTPRTPRRGGRRSALLPLAVLLVVVGLPACSGGGGGGGPTQPPPPAPAPQVVTIEVHDNEYRPQSVQVRPGDTVRWVMRGADPSHTVSARDGTFDSGFAFAQGGDVYERVFDGSTDGRTFEYSCVSHQGCCQMQGSVRVGEAAPPPSPGY